MTVISVTSVDAEAEVSDTSWTDVSSTVINLSHVPIDHMLWISCELSGVNANEPVGLRVTIDAVEVAFDHCIIGTADVFCAHSMMILQNFTTGTSYSLKLQAKCVDETQTATIRRRRLLIIQH